MDQKQNDTYLAGVMRKEEERSFIRYTGDSECELKIGSETYKGSVIDFSDGLGVIIEKIPELEKGTRAHVKIYDYEIEFGAEIAWIRESEDHLRIGFRRLDSFEGNLKHYRLPDVLTGIGRSEKTGVLEITSGSTVKQIYVKDGDKIFATSNSEDDRLGEYLLKHGRITVEEFEQASYLVTKKGQRLGKSLVDLGYLAPTELFQAVQQQIEEIILSLFSLEEGRFEFKEGVLSSVEAITLQSTTANLIYKGIKEIKNFVHVKSMCPPVDTVLNLSQIPVNIFKSLTLEDADKKILSYVNGVHPLKTILSLSPSTNFDTLKTISALLSIGFIHIKGKNEVPEKLPIERVFSESCEETAEESTEEMPEAETVMEEAGDGEEPACEEAEEVALIGEAETDEPVEAEDNEGEEENNLTSESDAAEEEETVSSYEIETEGPEEEGSPEAECLTEPAEAETAMEEAGDEEWGPYGEPEADELSGETEVEGPVGAEDNEGEEENISASESDTAEEEETVSSYEIETEGPGEEGSPEVENLTEPAEVETAMEEAGDEEWRPYEETKAVMLVGEAEVEEPAEVESNEAEEKNMFALDSDEVEAEAVMEEARVEKRLEKPDPAGPTDEIAAAANAVDSFQSYDSNIEEASEDTGRFQDNDEMKAHRVSESVETEMLEEEAEDVKDALNTLEITSSGKNRLYIYVVLLVVVILGAGVPLVYDNVVEFISNSFEQSEKIAEVPAVKPAIPPAVKNESPTSPPFPSFREDALRSLLNE